MSFLFRCDSPRQDRTIGSLPEAIKYARNKLGRSLWRYLGTDDMEGIPTVLSNDPIWRILRQIESGDIKCVFCEQKFEKLEQHELRCQSSIILSAPTQAITDVCAVCHKTVNVAQIQDHTNSHSDAEIKQSYSEYEYVFSCANPAQQKVFTDYKQAIDYAAAKMWRSAWTYDGPKHKGEHVKWDGDPVAVALEQIAAKIRPVHGGAV